MHDVFVTHVRVHAIADETKFINLFIYLFYIVKNVAYTQLSIRNLFVNVNVVV